MPILAATIAFVTYTSTTDKFDVAIIFASLSLFQLLRQPLMFLPRALSATTDAQNALVRLTKVFNAETQDPSQAVTINPEQELALEVKAATFEWEGTTTTADMMGDPLKGAAKKKVKVKGDEKGAATPTAGPPFQIKDVTMLVPRGALIAIVGSVGRYVVGGSCGFKFHGRSDICSTVARYDTLS